MMKLLPLLSQTKAGGLTSMSNCFSYFIYMVTTIKTAYSTFWGRLYDQGKLYF